MKKARCGPASPRAKTMDNSLSADNHNCFSARFSEYKPRKCEFCRLPLNASDRHEAPYADGKYLCKECRADYMDLYHPDPFGDDVVPEVAWT